MTRTLRAVIAAVAVALSAAPSFAQTREAPNFILSINGGVTTSGQLWSVPRQLVLSSPPGGGGGYDTVRLSRALQSGIVGTVLATLHRSPNLGYVAEIGYFGVASEGRCTMIGPSNLDGENKNGQACTAVEGASYRTSVVGFQGGLTYRLVPRGALSPYARATAGIGALGNSYIETSGIAIAPTTCGVCNWPLLYESKRKTLTWVATLAAGLTWRAGPGYQLRLEARDLIVALPIVSDSTGQGAPNPFPTARTGTLTRHVFVFTAGLDVVLERRHRRRY
jgi:hypothetical protein